MNKDSGPRKRIKTSAANLLPPSPDKAPGPFTDTTPAHVLLHLAPMLRLNRHCNEHTTAEAIEDDGPLLNSLMFAVSPGLVGTVLKDHMLIAHSGVPWFHLRNTPPRDIDGLVDTIRNFHLAAAKQTKNLLLVRLGYFVFHDQVMAHAHAMLLIAGHTKTTRQMWIQIFDSNGDSYSVYRNKKKMLNAAGKDPEPLEWIPWFFRALAPHQTKIRFTPRIQNLIHKSVTMYDPWHEGISWTIRFIGQFLMLDWKVYINLSNLNNIRYIKTLSEDVGGVSWKIEQEKTGGYPNLLTSLDQPDCETVLETLSCDRRTKGICNPITDAVALLFLSTTDEQRQNPHFQLGTHGWINQLLYDRHHPDPKEDGMSRGFWNMVIYLETWRMMDGYTATPKYAYGDDNTKILSGMLQQLQRSQEPPHHNVGIGPIATMALFQPGGVLDPLNISGDTARRLLGTTATTVATRANRLKTRKLWWILTNTSNMFRLWTEVGSYQEEYWFNLGLPEYQQDIREWSHSGQDVMKLLYEYDDATRPRVIEYALKDVSHQFEKLYLKKSQTDDDDDDDNDDEEEEEEEEELDRTHVLAMMIDLMFRNRIHDMQHRPKLYDVYRLMKACLQQVLQDAWIRKHGGIGEYKVSTGLRLMKALLPSGEYPIYLTPSPTSAALIGIEGHWKRILDQLVDKHGIPYVDVLNCLARWMRHMRELSPSLAIDSMKLLTQGVNRELHNVYMTENFGDIDRKAGLLLFAMERAMEDSQDRPQALFRAWSQIESKLVFHLSKTHRSTAAVLKVLRDTGMPLAKTPKEEEDILSPFVLPFGRSVAKQTAMEIEVGVVVFKAENLATLLAKYFIPSLSMLQQLIALSDPEVSDDDMVWNMSGIGEDFKRLAM